VSDTFFTVEPASDGSDWFVPTEMTRGPWDPDAGHAGPPTGLLARSLERLLPEHRLTRISVELGRPVPMAGFRIVADVVRAGRATANSRAVIVGKDGVERVWATGSHVAVSPVELFVSTLGIQDGLPRLADAQPGEFPIGRFGHGLPGFRDGVTVRYPPGEDNDIGPTTVWMHSIPLLPGEEMSPFQRICPLSDCGNAFSRHADPDQMRFLNTDLVVALHRDPVGEWMGSRVTSHWHPTGVGLSDALLFDDEGAVGRALQTLLLRPVG
jgi:hypothetical protein